MYDYGYKVLTLGQLGKGALCPGGLEAGVFGEDVEEIGR